MVPGVRHHGTHKRERWLNDDEIRALWAPCGTMGIFGALVRTQTASPCRTSANFDPARSIA
jgi:hypothetical protein